MKTTTHTTKINGARVIITTTKNGKVTVKPADVEEWVLQSAAVKALRAMPEYVAAVGSNPAATPAGKFTLAGDFNAARRSMRESVKAKATGLVAGEHDLRLYLHPGQLALIEFKAARTAVSADQTKRHALLKWLGFTRQAIIRATTEEDAAIQAVALVRGWLAASDAKNEGLGTAA